MTEKILKKRRVEIRRTKWRMEKTAMEINRMDKK